MQLASYLGRGPLMWMIPLHLHVNKKSNYDMMKQFGPRSGPKEHRSWSGFKWFDTDSVPERIFCKSYYWNRSTEDNKSKKLPSMQSVIIPPSIICSRRQFQILLLFSKIMRQDISWELSAGRQFSWNIIPYFFRKLGKMSSAEVVIGALRVNLISAEYWICKPQDTCKGG